MFQHVRASVGNTSLCQHVQVSAKSIIHVNTAKFRRKVSVYVNMSRRLLKYRFMWTCQVLAKSVYTSQHVNASVKRIDLYPHAKASAKRINYVGMSNCLRKVLIHVRMSRHLLKVLIYVECQGIS